MKTKRMRERPAAEYAKPNRLLQVWLPSALLDELERCVVENKIACREPATKRELIIRALRAGLDAQNARRSAEERS